MQPFDPARVEYPMFGPTELSLPEDGLRARHIEIKLCTKSHAVAMTRLWHSRLPNVQAGPWIFGFKAHYQDYTFATALWGNPSARLLPGHWLELRRLSCAPDAPKYTPSRMLGAMIRLFKRNHAAHEKCISYQDPSVHKGTIYKAAGWHIGNVGRPRNRDRSKPRFMYARGDDRLPMADLSPEFDIEPAIPAESESLQMYRLKDYNAPEIDLVGKIRWEIDLV